MASLTLELPVDIREHLVEEAEKSGRAPAEVALEILRRELYQKPEHLTRQEQIVGVLERAGLIRPISNELWALIVPGKDYEAIRRELMERVFDPPLSEIIMENRGEV